MYPLHPGRFLALLQGMNGEGIVYYELANIFSKEYTLALNMQLGVLSLIKSKGSNANPGLWEQQFTPSELSLLIPLLNAHPHYCPYEVLLASFNTFSVGEKAVEKARKLLNDAQMAGDGSWDYHMRPVRNVLSRTRIKLRELGLEVRAIMEVGYLLMAAK